MEAKGKVMVSDWGGMDSLMGLICNERSRRRVYDYEAHCGRRTRRRTRRSFALIYYYCFLPNICKGGTTLFM
jgi:hypothetical protein